MHPRGRVAITDVRTDIPCRLLQCSPSARHRAQAHCRLALIDTITYQVGGQDKGVRRLGAQPSSRHDGSMADLSLNGPLGDTRSAAESIERLTCSACARSCLSD